MLAFYVNYFLFVSLIFLESIFAMEILSTTIPYCSCINLVLLPNTFVQPFFSLNFSTSSIFLTYIAKFSLGRVWIIRKFVLLILFFVRYVSILLAIFLKAYFYICTLKALLFSFITSLFYLL